MSKHPKSGETPPELDLPDDLERDPGIGRVKGTDRAGADPDLLDADTTFEGDVVSDAGLGGGVDPNHQGRTNE